MMLLPAVANFAGGAAAEVLDVSDRTLSLALHLAAEIVLAVVGLELMPEALEATPAWVPLLAFVAAAPSSSASTSPSATSKPGWGGASSRPARSRSSVASRWTCSATAS